MPTLKFWDGTNWQFLMGAQGPQGYQGADSTAPGPQGLQGSQGPQGPQGFQGLAGSGSTAKEYYDYRNIPRTVLTPGVATSLGGMTGPAMRGTYMFVAYMYASGTGTIDVAWTGSAPTDSRGGGRFTLPSSFTVIATSYTSGAASTLVMYAVPSLNSVNPVIENQIFTDDGKSWGLISRQHVFWAGEG